MEILDQLNRTIQLKKTPRRIVSLVPSLTELICDLGLESNLVGVTKFCVHPQHIKTDVTVVGGTKQIHLEKIRALNPDIILCNKEENTLKIVETCETICPVHISDIYSIEDNLELIKQYGELFNTNSKAHVLIKNIQEASEGFLQFIKDQPIVKVAYFIWKKPWMVAANTTFINHLLELNKLQNVYSGLERYPEISLQDETIKEADILLLSSEPFPFKEKHIKELQKEINAKKIIIVDGEYFSWYGSRILKAFKYFKALRETSFSVFS